jgi:hypothetical protein
MYPMARALNRDLALWAVRKYRKLRRHLRRATQRIARISRRAPGLFADAGVAFDYFLHGRAIMSCPHAPRVVNFEQSEPFVRYRTVINEDLHP